jgi:hypothetical protein
MALPKIQSPSYTLNVPSTNDLIEYRPFIVKEQKTLLLAKESGDEHAMIRATRDLIASCVTSELDVSKLTLFDFEYLFLQIRAKSVGETSDVQIKCSECEEYEPVTINLEEAKLTETEAKSNKIALTDDVGIVMQYPKFEASVALLSRGDDLGQTDMAFETLIGCIESIYDESAVYPAEDSTRDELMEFVDGLSSKQFERMSEFIQGMPKIGLFVEFVCSKCGEKNNETITGLKNFF